MTDLLTRTQLQMLAQTLGVDPVEIAGLERLGAANVRVLRERISDYLFDAHAATFARVSKLAPLVPNALAAKVALKSIPAEVGGRAGGAIGVDHPDRAAGLLAELTPEYMADAAPFLDPRAIPVLAPRLPADVLIPAANELLRRKDYVTAARFVEHSTESLIRAFERGISDDEGLLRTAALTHAADKLNEIVRVLPPERQSRIIGSATSGDDETLLAGLSVAARLADDLAPRLVGELFDGLDEDALSRLLRVAAASDAVAELLVVSDWLNDDQIERIASSPALQDESIRDALEAAATPGRAERAYARFRPRRTPAPSTY